ncbi:MAG TPA: LysR family transcriptional regulator [Lachnospiraceae bacterium]|nr:LysR family transcriptional regulator [Lachnospiraceae bacterium]
MTLMQIEYYVAVCKYRNFTKAAGELHISQPGISKSMRELEEECGVALFERNHNNIVITKEGEILLESAQKFLEHFNEFDRIAHSLDCGKSILKIGVVPMCGNTVFPCLHRDFLEAFPDIQIKTIEETASVLYDLLDQHEIDFALCVTNHLPDEHYRYYILKKSCLELFVPKNSPLSGRGTVDICELENVPLVLFSDHFGQTKYIRRVFSLNGVQPMILHQTNQAFTILEYIRSQVASGFLSEEFAAEEADLVPVRIAQFSAAYVNLVWAQDESGYPSMRKFIQFVKTKYPAK